MFTISEAPSGSEPVCKVVTRLTIGDLIGQCNNALPLGNQAMIKLGGVETVFGAKKDNGGFPDEQIVIPVGVTPQNLKSFTLYDILGFGSMADSVDTDAIKKAYHKAVLMYHPDKAQYKLANGEEDRSVFLKIQEAFAVLTNDDKRRAYDSQLPFDETIPNEDKVRAKMEEKGPVRFFKYFDPVFKRNARFAVKKPVPELGNMDTPLSSVRKFYEYWIRFESWRDFTGVDAEHKPDDAGSREEKRWMQKENAKIAVKKKQKEMERIIALVTLAQKMDPRLVAEKEAKKNAKEAEKNAKEAAVQRKAEEDRLMKEWAEAEENAAKGGSAEMSKAEKEKLKKAQSKARNIFRKLLRLSVPVVGDKSLGEYGAFSDNEVELLCSCCEMEVINSMNDAMGGEAATKEGSESLFVYAGVDSIVRPKLESVKGLADRDADDERIAKLIKKRETEDKGKPKYYTA